jgi:hypothetical protein
MSHDSNAAPRRAGTDRRAFFVKGGTVVAAAFLASPDGASAHGGHDHDVDPASDFLVVRVEAHESPGAIRVLRLDNAARVDVAVAPEAVLPTPGGTRTLDEVRPGETLVVVAPRTGAAAARRRVIADRLVQCTVGVWADAQRIRAAEAG